MKSLDEFLALPNVDDIEDEVYVSKRLGKFKIKAMNSDEFSEYQRRATGKIKKEGTNFDIAKFNLLIAAGQTVEPNFNNAELLKKAGCTTASELVAKKLLAGEISTLSGKIQEISGFDNDVDADLEEAKN